MTDTIIQDLASEATKIAMNKNIITIATGVESTSTIYNYYKNEVATLTALRDNDIAKVT